MVYTKIRQRLKSWSKQLACYKGMTVAITNFKWLKTVQIWQKDVNDLIILIKKTNIIATGG